jgi:ABC-2 type transport system permease protein
MYGTQVMRSVTEEKTNRIVEILISTVRPFQLMMGKVIGVGFVGLTQIAIWIVIIPIILLIGVQFMGLNESQMQEMNSFSSAQMDDSKTMIVQVLTELKTMNWFKIISITLFYFLGGYFTYAALFAALGSAVGEDANEAQTLTFPVMLPLIIAVYIAMSAVSSPNSSLAIWSSMFPLFSPVIMPVRLPFDPPLWQLLVSMFSLLVFAVFLVWLAGRIYRVGILMYGKKASFKELAKWIFKG